MLIDFRVMLLQVFLSVEIYILLISFVLYWKKKDWKIFLKTWGAGNLFCLGMIICYLIYLLIWDLIDNFSNLTIPLNSYGLVELYLILVALAITFMKPNKVKTFLSVLLIINLFYAGLVASVLVGERIFNYFEEPISNWPENA